VLQPACQRTFLQREDRVMKFGLRYANLGRHAGRHGKDVIPRFAK
jgi:hypothetical protein